MIESANKESVNYKQIYDVFHKRIEEDEVKRYSDMLGIHKNSNKCKFVSFGAFVLLILITSLVPPKTFAPYELSDNWLYYLLLLVGAVILNIAISFILHHTAYYKLVNSYIKSDRGFFSHLYEQFCTVCGPAKKVISFLISPDYYFATKYKSMLIKKRIPCIVTSCYRDSEHRACPNEWDTIRNSRKFFVEFSNWYNVIVTIWAAIIISIILMWFPDNHILILLQFLYCLLLFRLISRSLEICWAYYKDIVGVDVIRFSKKQLTWTSTMKEPFFNGWKRSSIRRSGRISLAVHTLFEMMILYSLLYYFQYAFYPNLVKDFMGYKGQILYSYYNFLLHSISVSSFNISFGPFPTKGWLFLHASQVLISMVLIIVSLAAYLGSKDDVTEREEDFFNRALPRLKSASDSAVPNK